MGEFKNRLWGKGIISNDEMLIWGGGNKGKGSIFFSVDYHGEIVWSGPKKIGRETP